MSGIYIPGMEMPTCCDRCIYSGWSNFYQIYICTARWRQSENEALLFDKKRTNSVVTMRSGRADNCPLVPVPDHGRLVDKDTVCAECRRVAGEYDGIYPDCTYCPIHIAPTIIPADKEAGE